MEDAAEGVAPCARSRGRHFASRRWLACPNPPPRSGAGAEPIRRPGGGGRRLMAALAGVRVVELARVLAGPTTGQTLADLGADVIKVESPGGDETRAWGPPFIETEGEKSAAYFHSCNRGKRSIVADFATERGCEIVRRLAAPRRRADREFQGRGLEEIRARLREPERAQSAPHLLLGDGLRADRPLRKPRRLRLSRPGHVGDDEHNRRARRLAAEGGGRDQRSVHRALWRHRHRGGA